MRSGPGMVEIRRLAIFAFIQLITPKECLNLGDLDEATLPSVTPPSPPSVEVSTTTTATTQKTRTTIIVEVTSPESPAVDPLVTTEPSENTTRSSNSTFSTGAPPSSSTPPSTLNSSTPSPMTSDGSGCPASCEKQCPQQPGATAKSDGEEPDGESLTLQEIGRIMTELKKLNSVTAQMKSKLLQWVLSSSPTDVATLVLTVPTGSVAIWHILCTLVRAALGTRTPAITDQSNTERRSGTGSGSDISRSESQLVQTPGDTLQSRAENLQLEHIPSDRDETNVSDGAQERESSPGSEDYDSLPEDGEDQSLHTPASEIHEDQRDQGVSDVEADQDEVDQEVPPRAGHSQYPAEYWLNNSHDIESASSASKEEIGSGSITSHHFDQQYSPRLQEIKRAQMGLRHTGLLKGVCDQCGVFIDQFGCHCRFY